MRGTPWVLGVVCLSLVACHDKQVKRIDDGDREGGHVGGTPTPTPTPTLPGGGTAPVVETCPPLCPPPDPTLLARKAAPNPIPAENALPGEPAWRSFRQALKGEIDVYASTEAGEAGDTFGVRVSTDGPQDVTVDVLRLGWYGGAGARKVFSSGPFKADRQPACPMDPVTGVIACPWTDTFKLTIGADWVSGMYLIKVKRADGFARWTPFVVRDHRAAEILFQPGLATSQAYNAWQGVSLYGDSTGTLPNHRSVMVSFDRPYKDKDGAGLTLHQETPFAQFLERYGYDVTYGTNLDFSRFRDVLSGIGAFVIAGHDEYWAPEERAQVDAAVAAGQMSLAYFGGNGGYWRTRMLSAADGRPLRTLVCYKGSPRDPLPGSTARYRDDPDPHPENALWGTMYTGWQLVPFPLTVSNPSHWIYQGTNLAAGDLLHGLIGNEFDETQDNGATPPGLSIAAEGPVVTAEGIPSRAQIVERTLPSGRLVFSAGTIGWAQGLTSNPDVKDGRLERMTLNVLERALSHRRPPRTLAAVTGPSPVASAPDPRWAGEVSAFAGVAGQTGDSDGPGDGARFFGPTGLAVTPDGKVVVTEAAANRVRLIGADPAHTVSLLAGNGLPGGRDGPGAQAMFRAPTGVAIGADGAAYVADSDNHVIRRVELTTPFEVSVFAGAFRAEGYADGTGPDARFDRPTAIAADKAGNLYVADQANHRVRKISWPGRVVTTLAGSGDIGQTDAADGAQASFNNPSAIAVSAGGDLYVLDGGTGLLRRVSAAAPHAVVRLAGEDPFLFGYRDGPGTTARFRAQLGMAFTPTGELVLADTGNYRLRLVVPGADAASTRVYTSAGSGRQGTALGPPSTSDLVAPTGVAFFPDGSAVVSDSYNNVVRRVGR